MQTCNSHDVIVDHHINLQYVRVSRPAIESLLGPQLTSCCIVQLYTAVQGQRGRTDPEPNLTLLAVNFDNCTQEQILWRSEIEHKLGAYFITEI